MHLKLERMKAWTLIIFSLASILCASAQQCGSQAGGAFCPNCLCCSQWGYCGSGDAWCGTGCQSQCDQGFYTYDDFIAAAKHFEGFAQGDDSEICKREIAAFLGQTSHETTGGWPDAPDGPYAWGYCFKEEVGATADYCVPSVEWPCVAGKKYYGRGPIQISYNYNYGPAGKYLGLDLLSDPDLVASDGMVSFETAFWFWMTPQSPKPSCHDVMTGNWTPSAADIAAGRLPGYGLCTNIINGRLECGGTGPDARVEDRIGFYERYCDILGVSYGDNLDCYNMSPYGLRLFQGYKVLDSAM